VGDVGVVVVFVVSEAEVEAADSVGGLEETTPAVAVSE